MSKARTAFLKELFTYMGKNDLPYVVARCFEALPEKLGGNDLDIIVEKASISSIIQYVENNASAHITSISKRSNVVNLFLHFGEGDGLQLDLMHALTHKYTPYLDINAVLKARLKHKNGYYIPAPAHHYMLMLLPHALYTGEPKPAYKQQMESLYAAHTEQIDVLLKEDNINNCNYSEKYFFRKNKIGSFFGRLRYNFAEIWARLRQPARQRVVFLGPDGAGKSSVIAGVEQGAQHMAKELLVQHLKPTFFFKKRAIKRGVVTEPHKLPPRNWLLSNIKVTLMAVEYLLDYWLRPKRGSVLELYDRYLHDVLIDSARYRFAGSKLWVKCLLKLIPKADLVVLIHSTAEAIHSRKAEVPFETTKAQCAAYYDYVSALKNGVIIDATQPLDTVITDTITQLGERLDGLNHESVL